MAKTVKSLKVALQTGNNSMAYATWSAPTAPKHPATGYEVQWRYYTGDGIGFIGQDTTQTTYKQSTYSFPSNAVKVRVRVKPVSPTHTVNKKETAYWTGAWSQADLKITTSKTPETPSAPTVQIENLTLTAKLENISDSYTKQVQFQVVQDDSKVYKTGTVNVTTSAAAFSCAVTSGHEYKVRCRGYNTNIKEYGDWGDYSSNVGTVPSSVSSVSCSGDSSTSVKVTFGTNSQAKSYNIEYTTNKSYFDSSSEVSSLSVTASPAYVTSLESGQEWFFRVQAVNDNGTSGWSKIVSTVIGSAPAAPTTWSSATSVMLSETVTLYWVHNSEDGSKSRGAQIELVINGTTSTVTVASTDYDSADAESIYSYSRSFSGYYEGTVVKWRVRTKGVTGEYGPYSVQRQIVVYAQPTLSLTYSDSLSVFPYEIECQSGPTAQTPISYSIVVKAVSSHETTNEYGGTSHVNAGEVVYSTTVYSSDYDVTLTLSVDNVTLTNGESYEVEVTVGMDSGLTADDSFTFIVDWEDIDYDADAEIAIDSNALLAYISPYCIDDNEELVSDVVLSVYRREFDGTFTEIGSELENNGYISVTDPHPALDYARYRIVVRKSDTGAMAYDDLPGIPVGEPGIVLQWDEDWSEFDIDEDNEDEMETQPWAGSLLKLPYNTDTSEEHAPDVSLVNYIGRSHPVSYYGTQKGETATWSAEFDRDDEDTRYALRRLAAYMGDVYVRCSSGVGYWAQVTVSVSDTHQQLLVPVSLKITRVEGGM